MSEDRREEISFSWPCACVYVERNRQKQSNSVATLLESEEQSMTQLTIKRRARERLKHLFPLYQAGLWLLDVPVPSVDSLWQTSMPVFKVIYSGKNKIEWWSANVFIQLLVFLEIQSIGNLRLVGPLDHVLLMWTLYLSTHHFLQVYYSQQPTSTFLT